MLFQVFERPFYAVFFRVALEVCEENVGPGPFAARAALDAGQVDPRVGERREGVFQYAGAVF